MRHLIRDRIRDLIKDLIRNVIRNLMERIDELENQVINFQEIIRNSNIGINDKNFHQGESQNLKDKEIIEFIGKNKK